MKRNVLIAAGEKSYLKSLLLFSLPLIAINVLQYFFGATNITVLGVFIKDEVRANASIAAVGATTTLIAFALSFAVALSVGVNALVACCVGENDKEKSKKLVGTSVWLGIVYGVVIGLLGIVLSERLLVWTNCSGDVLNKATIYLRIYFLGFPFITVYNVLAAILRSVGDTVRPSVYLCLAIVLNVVISILCATVFDLDVEGAAISSVLSQVFSCVLAFIRVIRTDGFSKLELKTVRFFKKEIFEIIKVSVPVIIHMSIASLANLIVQSAVNALGDRYITGYTIAIQIDNVIYQAMAAVAVASLSFVAVNYGAKDSKGIRNVTRAAIIIVAAIGVLALLFILFFARGACGILTSEDEIINIAMKRLSILSVPYTARGIIEVFANVMRGINGATVSMVIGVINCLLQILMIYTLCRVIGTYEFIIETNIIVWVISLVAYVVFYIKYVKKIKQKNGQVTQ